MPIPERQNTDEQMFVIQQVLQHREYEQQKQQTAGDLAVENVAEAKNQEGQLHCPVTLDEGRADVHQLVLDGDAALYKEMADAADQVHEEAGDGTEEHQQPVHKCPGFAKFQIL